MILDRLPGADLQNVYPTLSTTEMRTLAHKIAGIQRTGIIDERQVDRVAARHETHRAYFERVARTPFLDDTTTKNVIIDNGKLSGIVDIDMVCFGDPLFTVALTRMSLLSREYDVDYIGFWCAELNITTEQANVLDAYTALVCVDFLGEIGQR